MVAGAIAPLVRRRVRVSPLVMQATAFAAPVGLCVAVRRTRTRDVAVCALQMWAYLAAYKSPHDDPDAQARLWTAKEAALKLLGLGLDADAARGIQAVLLGGYGGGWVPAATALSMPFTEEAARSAGSSLGAWTSLRP